MASTTPPLSIGLAVYNGAPFLPLAFDSLLGQTFGDFELIVSDNASTDSTEEICRHYAATDPRVRYVRLPHNRGAVYNFNHVLEMAAAPLFKWAAHDDVCLPTFLERCVDVLRQDPTVGWCHSRSRHIDADGLVVPDAALRDVTYLRPEVQTSDHTRGSLLPHQRLAAVMLGSGGCLDIFGVVRRELLGQTQRLLPYYGSEKVLISELALRSRYAEVAEHLFHVRIHTAGSGAQATAQQQQEFVDPQARRRGSTRIGLLRSYLHAIQRAPLPTAERLRCYAVVARYLLQVRKWRSVAWKFMTGAGVGGGNVERLRQATRSAEPSAAR